MARPSDRYEFRWTSRHLAVLIVACVVAASVFAIRTIHPQVRIGRDLPVWPDRVGRSVLRIDPNTAPAAHLQCLPGIGPAKAGAIVAYRSDPEAMSFRAPDDLAAVHGIGKGLVGKMTPFLRFE